MSDNGTQDAVIEQYLDQVAANLPDASPQEREETLRELRDHIRESVRERSGARPPTLRDVYAALSEMDPPEEFARLTKQPTPSPAGGRDLTVLAIICAVMQIVGLAAIAVGIPLLPSLSGFAAIVAYFLARARQQKRGWQRTLHAVGAVCGVGLILIDFACMA